MKRQKSRHIALLTSIPVLLAASVLALTGCKPKNHEPVDLSSIHTTAAQETMVSTTAARPEPATTAPAAPETSAAIAQMAYELKTFTPEAHDTVSISYPVLSGMSDSAKQESVNKLLLENACAFYESMLPTLEGSVTMEIDCRIASLDRNRVTAVYTGSCMAEKAAYPVNVFFTNTIDLQQVKSLGINDYSDAYTMAGYLMSEDVQFYQADADMTESLLAYRADQSVEAFTKLLNQADFPLKASAAEGSFPESFSYMEDSVLYFSIPVPHALGDYAIVSYPIDGK